MQVTLNPKVLAAVQLFSGKQDVRFYLNGVFIEPNPEGGIVMTATNGVCGMSVVDKDGSCDAPGIIPRLPETWLKAFRGKATWDGTRLADEQGFSFPAARIEYDKGFPDWRVVWGRAGKNGNGEGAYDTRYLGLCTDFAKRFKTALRVGVCLSMIGRDKFTPCKVAFHHLPEGITATAVIMPVRL